MELCNPMDATMRTFRIVLVGSILSVGNLLKNAAMISLVRAASEPLRAAKQRLLISEMLHHRTPLLLSLNDYQGIVVEANGKCDYTTLL